MEFGRSLHATKPEQICSPMGVRKGTLFLANGDRSAIWNATCFFSENDVDAILMGRLEDVYTVGSTYKVD
jgi:hypothetical protein